MTESAIDLDALIARRRANDFYVPCRLDAGAVAKLAQQVDKAARLGRALVIPGLRGDPWKIPMRRYNLSCTRLHYKCRAAKDEFADDLENVEKMFPEHQYSGSAASGLMR